jgi:APA family basic amino acid/polyamine antiporter
MAMMTALMYSELSSRIPISGSAYTYTYVTFGELPAWLVAWNMNLRYGFGSAGLARGMCEYGTGLFSKFGVVVPAFFTNFTFLGFEKCSLLSVIFLGFLTEVFVRGMHMSNMFNKALTISKLCTLFFIITMALFNFKTENLNPFTLEEKGGFKATIKAAGLVFFSYLGFDMITTLSDEAKNPVKDVPLAVKDNTIIVTIIYFVTAFSICGMARL